MELGTKPGPRGFDGMIATMQCVRTLEAHFVRCETHNSRCMEISEDIWDALVEALKAINIELVGKERAWAWGAIEDTHLLRTVLTAVHEVQGLKMQEGCSVIPALESLVAKYAELK